MVKMKNIHPLSDFLRNAKARIGELKKSGEPAILTVNGQAEAVLLSAEAYENFMEELETERTLNATHQGALEALRSGQIAANELIASLKPEGWQASVSAREAFAQLERKFSARRKKKAS